MSREPDPFSGGFARAVTDAMERRGVGLRELCRGVGLDASFFSKVLSGKRSPPSQESVLRRVAAFLGLDAVGLIVSAGRVPSEWRALVEDPGMLHSAHSLITGGSRPPASKPSAPRSLDLRKGGLSDELL
ncbi:MAG: helix-turn-helix domain-containing protein [Elusimicrobia bacterium]|nr:helix-turn-helix domain-containing protein [Elusimicrobiota bacterium]